MLDNGNYQRPNLCVGRWNHWTGHWIGINLFRGVPCGLARLRIPRYTRERERDCHGPPPMPTFHDTRALASGFSLSLRSNRSTCQSYALYRFSRPSLSPCILSLGIEYVAIFTYMVNINWFRADPSLSQRSVIERATWFDIFLFLQRIFKERERERVDVI